VTMFGTIELTGRASGEFGLQTGTLKKILAAAEVGYQIDDRSICFRGEVEHVLAAIAVICRLHAAAGSPIDVNIRWNSGDVSRWALRPPAKTRLIGGRDDPGSKTVN